MTPNELIVTVAAMFPRAFPSETAVTTWLETYRRTLGHLRPDQLQEAWDRTIAKWEKTSPPMPKHLLDNVPVQVRVTSGSSEKTMRGMAEALPQIMGDLMRDWWKANAHWFDNECQARGLNADQKRHATGWLNSYLRTVAHYQAQLQYWKDDNSPAMLSDDQVSSIFSFTAAPRNPLSPFVPNMEAMKAAYVRDGGKPVKYEHWHSWMEESRPDESADVPA